MLGDITRNGVSAQCMSCIHRDICIHKAVADELMELLASKIVDSFKSSPEKYKLLNNMKASGISVKIECKHFL